MPRVIEMCTRNGYRFVLSLPAVVRSPALELFARKASDLWPRYLMDVIAGQRMCSIGVPNHSCAAATAASLWTPRAGDCQGWLFKSARGLDYHTLPC